MNKYILLKFSIFIIINYFFTTSLFCSNPFIEQLEMLKQDPKLTHGIIGLNVVDLNANNQIYAFNDKIVLSPASTQKIIITASALCILGKNFKYVTTIEYDGYIDSVQQILHGNLYVKGGGDPTLESYFFKQNNDSSDFVKEIIDVLKIKRIKTIDGSIIGDGSIFDGEVVSPNWTWEDIGNYFGAGSFGLSYKDNMYALGFKTKEEGTLALLNYIKPNILGLEITSNVIAKGIEDSAYIYGSPYTFQRYINGSLPPNKENFEIKGAMPNPPLFLAQEIHQSCLSNKISVLKAPISYEEHFNPIFQLNQPRKTLFKHISPSLDRIIYFTNMFSVNLFAENLVKTISLQDGQVGHSTEGLNKIISFWNKRGVNTDGLDLADGCGMARKNSVSCEQLTQILTLMSKEKQFNSFYNSLPVSGISGTLINFGKGTNLEGRIHAKSGSYKKVRSMAGYIKTNHGKTLCFAMIINNYSGSSSEMKQKIESLVKTLVEVE